MSRVGKKPIALPQGVKVRIEKRRLTVKGPKGELVRELPESISATLDGQILAIERASDSKRNMALHGTNRSLIANMVEGVSKGFEKTLQIVGVGYRARVDGRSLVMQLGFSHPIQYDIPQEVTIAVGKDNTIAISGCDKQRVGQVAAEIRAYFPPEPYKGKGIRYKDEWVRRKAGKAMAT